MAWIYRVTRLLGNNLPLTWFQQFQQLMGKVNRRLVVTEETCHPVVFVSKLTYCLPLPDSPNLEGLLHMLAGLMQPLGVFKCEILVKKTEPKGKTTKRSGYARKNHLLLTQ